MAKTKLSLGQELKLFRIHNNLSQAEIARRLNIQVVTVSRWEREISEPNERHIFQIEKLLKEYGGRK